jgi:CBS domain-containing protein
MQVKDVLERNVDVVGPETPIREVARRMYEGEHRFLPVVEDGRLIGVITDRDIVIRGIARSMNAETTPVREIMSVQVVCIFEDEASDHARDLMLEHHVRHLPVIDRNHTLVGMVELSRVGGGEKAQKKSMKVTFHKEKTDSYGRPHKVPVKTVYITGTADKQAAEEVAVKRLEEESGTEWTNVATGFETEEEPVETAGKQGKPA